MGKELLEECEDGFVIDPSSSHKPPQKRRRKGSTNPKRKSLDPYLKLHVQQYQIISVLQRQILRKAWQFQATITYILAHTAHTTQPLPVFFYPYNLIIKHLDRRVMGKNAISALIYGTEFTYTYYHPSSLHIFNPYKAQKSKLQWSCVDRQNNI